MPKTTESNLRQSISTTFTRIEDVVYVGLGVLLAASAVSLLVAVAVNFGQGVLSGDLRKIVVQLLDQILLIFMIVEILYTVQVSFREHTLMAEPFLIVGLIAAIRRILIITAEFSEPAKMVEEAFRSAMLELGLLTLLILALVVSLYLVKKHRVAAAGRD
jgi:phosphate starvation-inducible membrane PsiE